MKNSVVMIPSIREASYIFKKEFRKNKSGLLSLKINNTDILVTGVGKILSAINAYRIFSSVDADEFYLTGICGAYRQSNLDVGDIVTILEDHFVDEGIFQGDKITGTHEIGFPICNKNVVTNLLMDDVKIVNGNTVSLCSGADWYAEILHKKTNADVETMEGASVGLVGELFNKKIYHIRSVSNFCGDRKNQEWNISLSIENLSTFLRERVIF
jgi:futalosine hydrolase